MIETPAPSQTKRKKTINDITNELDPMDRLLEQARMRAEKGDVCADDVFIVHWTHVPKAGGTAFAGMAKKISCARNPAIASSNPCCVRDVCVAEGSCHSTASTCPLVQGIGKHTSNMGRLALVPCCGREWYLSTVISFLPVWKLKFCGAFVSDRHAIDAMPARWRGGAGSSPLDGASTAAEHPPHWLISTQVPTVRHKTGPDGRGAGQVRPGLRSAKAVPPRIKRCGNQMSARWRCRDL